MKFKKFKMKNINRYKLLIFGKVFCFDFKYYGNILKGGQE